MINGQSDHNGELKSEMNIVPMIDVLLVLLIVFMIASPQISSSVEVNLPQTSIEQKQVEQNQSSVVVVTLDKTDGIFLTNTALGILDEPKDPKHLVLELAAIKNVQPESEVFLKADKETSYKKVMFGLELIKSSGFEDVNLVSEVRE
ncbi:ExbD/TolR family protein [Photobacterium galatheae]|uniref:Biopolymer transporter ExbD n=1 Tax=Photobacterium galatheae TaxID=1654360 RepID=A0A066RKB6_9GAMM|nr:biopolymer transporter ExbD [Photobacterium galatheae]KDM90890.1 hypothetical protein EA58_14110 [Photobacterium galatheae]MCM0149142.1 biopolymer transporter ExbD [Photobacterium galatheae]